VQQVEKYGAPRLGQVVTLNEGVMERLQKAQGVVWQHWHAVHKKMSQTGESQDGEDT
jgi:hypothetical protein